jgi:gamma-glutamylcysteine synthetase
MGPTLSKADGNTATQNLTFHSAVITESRGDYRGETWAELDGVECGHVKWRSDEHTTTIDYLETLIRFPLLGVRLLKAVYDYQKQHLDPGLMNDAGKRLWRLFCARYSYH